jgi:hypothetical protein
MKRWIWVTGAAAIGIAVLLIILLLPSAQAPQVGEMLLAAADGLDSIAIDATFDPDTQTLAVSQTFTLQNRTGQDQTELVLRTYAAAFRDEDYAPSATEDLHSLCYPDGFSAGGIEITSDDLSYEYTDEAQTVMVIALGKPWKSGETMTLTLTYTLTIPDAAYRFGTSNGVYALGNAFAIPAAWIDGEYRTDEYYSIGDPFVSECRNYTVRLTLPEGYTAAGSGAAETEGRVTTFTALASRDFALCISKKYHSAELVQDGVQIKAYARTAAHAGELLDIAKLAMHTYAGLYGAYPYPAMTLAEADLPFDGMSYPSLAMIDSDVVIASEETREIAVAREIAKQWFQQVVGTDGYDQAWQHEALAEYALLSYWEARHGAAARESLQYSREDTAMRLTVGDLTPGSPLSCFYDWGEYRTVVWHRGAAALCALELALDGKLDEFLAAYYDTYAFSIASRTDFMQALQAYSGEDWTPLLDDYLDTVY